MNPFPPQPPLAPAPLPPGAPPPVPEQDEGSAFHILQLVDAILDQRLLITAILLAGLGLGMLRAMLATPIYESNIVLQVEDLRTGNLGLSANPAEARSAAAPEIEILRSRLVLGKVVDELRLTVTARPKHLPVVGSWLARRADSLSQPGFLGLPGYVTGNERISIGAIEMPERERGKTYTVVLGQAGEYALQDPTGRAVATGRVGRELSFSVEGQPGTLLISELTGLPGAEFRVSQSNRLGVIQSLQSQLVIVEKPLQSGIIHVTLRGSDPWRVARLLNQIGDQYVQQNLSRKAAETENTLKFLTSLMPQARQQLEGSEASFNQLRKQKGFLDFTREATTVLERVSKLQATLAELQQKKRELELRYTAEHPQVQFVESQLQNVRRELASVSSGTAGLPDVEQEFLRLTRDVKINTDLYTSLLNSFQQLRVLKEGKVSNVRVLDAAEVPRTPVAPDRLKEVSIALLAALLLALLAAWLRNTFTVGIKDPGEVEAKAGLPLLATVPHTKAQAALALAAASGQGGVNVLALSSPNDTAIEALRSLRTAMQFAMLDARNNILLITGPTPGIGKSFLSLNFAAVLGATGKRVLLIDADLRKGRLHQFLGLQRAKGLSEVVAGTLKLDEALHTGLLPQVDFLSTGTLPPNPADVMNALVAHGLPQELSSRYDFVIFDSPPVLVAADTAILAPHVGAVLMVARSRQTHLGELAESKRRLQQAGGHIKGAVFNDMDLSRRRYGYGYGYGYSYRYGGYRYGRYRYTQYKY